MMKRVYSILVLVMVSVTAIAQDITLKGVITDSQGPLVGATVQIQGTPKIVLADVNGNYSIVVPKGKTIIFSYAGCDPQSFVIENQTKLDVKLAEASTELENVVVVGYGSQRKATLTGSVAAITGDKLKKSNVASLSNALQGQLAGVTVQQTSGEPGADGASIKVRGIGSINSSQSPLVLVDGIEMDINQVDMNTVQSISVLKDAASASIYGSRASNGVILVTTKRGQEGRISVSYNGYVTIQQPTNMPKPVAAWQYLESELNAWDNAGISVSPSQREQQLAQIEHQKNFKPDNWNYYDTDWKNATIKPSAIMHSHNVTLSGGNKYIQFFGAGTYMNQDGLIKNNGFERANLRLNVDAQIRPWLKFSVDANMRQSTAESPSASSAKSIINSSLYMLPTLSAVHELDGNWGYGKNGMNPTALAAASGKNTTVSSEFMANGTLTLTPVKGLEIIGQYSLRQAEGRSRKITTPYTTSLGGTVMGIYPAQDGVSEAWSKTIRNYYRAQARYSAEINKHSFGIQLGMQAEDNSYSSFNASARGFEFGKYYLGNGDGATAAVGGGANSWAMMSYYGRLNYSYDDKYLFEAVGRFDGSSRFTPENRWGFFPSVSVGWVISREKFMEGAADVISHLKIRASYGILGNQDIGNYPYASTISPGYGYWFDKDLWPGVSQTSLANPNITWEKSNQLDIGIDVSLFDSRLTLTADYYIKTVYDMLLKFPLPYYAGMGAAWSNAGVMENRGWEVAIGWRETRGDWTYGIQATVNDNRNKITDLKGLTTQDKSMVVGYPNQGQWGYLTDGYYRDWDDVNNSPKVSTNARPGFVKYKKVDPNGDQTTIGSNDRVYLGDPFPHYEFGLTLSGGWKGIDLQLFFQGVGERSAYMSGIGLKPFSNGANLFEHQLDSWTNENQNQNAAYPLLVPESNSGDNYYKSDKWVRSGAYVRLKNLVLGYSLPDKWMRSIGLTSLRVYFSAQNLFTVSGFYPGYDPEVSYAGSLGGEFYPVMQTFSFGLDLKF